MKDFGLRRSELGVPLTADPDGLVGLRFELRPVYRDGTLGGVIAAQVWEIPALWDFIDGIYVSARGLRDDGRFEHCHALRFDFTLREGER